MGVQYLVLWLEVEIRITSIDAGCGMDVFLSEIGQGRIGDPLLE
jgi:hypothetical protein